MCAGFFVARRSCDDLLDRLRAFDADEFLVQPAEEERELVRVQPQQRQRRGVEVLDRDLPLEFLVRSPGFTVTLA